MNTASLPELRRQGRLMFGLVTLLLALPFAVAGGLYFGGWQPAHSVAHGQLLNPPAALPGHGLRTPAGAALATAELSDKWLLILVAERPCLADCVERIDEMRRIQVALNKDMGRLRRVVLAGGEDATLTEMARQQPDLQYLIAPPVWLKDLASAPLHLVDPLGQRVMAFPATTPAREIRADLERLLKYSWTG